MQALSSGTSVPARVIRVEHEILFRYSVIAMNSRRYVQRERARKTARTATSIENAALREVARRGYPDLRVADVARRAHVSARTVYLHSSSKERLVEQALRRRGA